jgi:hypothetical protein
MENLVERIKKLKTDEVLIVKTSTMTECIKSMFPISAPVIPMSSNYAIFITPREWHYEYFIEVIEEGLNVRINKDVREDCYSISLSEIKPDDTHTVIGG